MTKQLILGVLVFETMTALSIGQGLQVAPPSLPFAAGVDVSELQTLQEHGAVYRDNGKPGDPYEIFRNNGINWLRIRLFVQPSRVGPLVNDLSYTLGLARTIKSHGFHLLLDLHYSDAWADPGHQQMPSAWARLTHEQLVTQVRSYTFASLRALASEDASPDMVQIGNEITNGMMWEDGEVSPDSSDSEKWDHLSDLLKAGIDGLHDAAGQKPLPQIMIHIDRGGDEKASRSFFDHILARGVHFDIIGLSDYPWWQGSIEQLSINLSSLAYAYQKPMIVVETGFPWHEQIVEYGGRQYDGQEAVSRVLHYPATPTGQAQYLQQLIAAVQHAPNGLGAGVFYWAGAWIKNSAWNPPPWSRTWEERSLFDDQGNALPALRVLGAASSNENKDKVDKAFSTSSKQ